MPIMATTGSGQSNSGCLNPPIQPVTMAAANQLRGSDMAATAQPVSQEFNERRVRVELAAMYRISHFYGWTDVIDTHLTARVPGTDDQYFINPYGLMFDEITASTLLKVDFEGNVLEGDYPTNEAGHLIHTAVLKARPDLNVVLHTHARASSAVSAMECGLLPISQQANEVIKLVRYHDYHNVVASPEAECEALARDMGDDAKLMIMRNHGLLSGGRTMSEAFWLMMRLETACKIQVDVLGSGQPYVTPSQDAIDDLAAYAVNAEADDYDRYWQAALRLAHRKYPGFDA
ncbi:MAG: class II aldolase [Rhodospirillaceae bacterium]|nr:class II aldolase [Rhodospirillaceae bacterium]